jgi:MoaA/NifB/PqqE/SkfB family radical SAM enzyme
MYKYKDIRMVHLEITQACQAACPMCDRNENGGVDNKHMTNAELSLEDCQKIFKPEFIKQLEVMYMCGNLGDPIVAKDTLEVFRYFRANNPKMWLSMNTNAGAKTAEWWAELASVIGRNGTVIFSVDGLSDTNHLYRQNVNWAIVERNMRAFIAAGGRARWDYIIFEHNQHQVEEAEALAAEWGVEKFMKKKTGRFFSTSKHQGKESHQAQNRKGVQTVTLKKPKEEFQNLAMAKEKELVKTYGSMIDYYNKCEVECKVAKEGNIFVTAEGLLLPCCWTAGRMYKWWHEDYRTEQIWDFIDRAGGKTGISLLDNDLEQVIDNSGLLQDITNSWSKPSLKEGKLGVCANKCGTEFDAFKLQFEE